ncbi:MAG: ThuA domain-containing protein [Verrucomicrobia bacterium]|nr:ThuA domain-containing protein [Verrucomicrobiota bacterium]
MKNRIVSLLVLSLFAWTLTASAAEPLRVFIRGGKKSHGPGQHEHEQFLRDWNTLLTERGCKVEGAMDFPTAEQLAKSDVLILHSQEGGEIPAASRPSLEAFLKRGGGIVVIHAANVPAKNSPDGAAYLKSVIGGTWVWGTTKWLEGPMSLYYVDRTHPITSEAGNYDISDEIYYDMDVSPDVHVLAAAYTPNISSAKKNDTRGQPQKGKITVYDIQPQMWTYEKDNYRAFAHIHGHLYENFSKPHYRAVLLRGIAWAGKRANVDELCTKAELASLRYPEGGTPSPKDLPGTLAVHPEFKVSLVASEPLINKVMNIDWDAQGRLWVCETPEYPDGRSINPGTDYVQRWQKDNKLTDDGKNYDRPAYDRISILTSSKGDGVMDKKQIFADFAHGVPGGLERVTSFVHYKDGVIASAAPHVWLLRDTNGDGVCDKAELLYTNLGDRDTHAVINNLRWGFDGWIYATHGYSSSPHVTSGDGKRDFGTIGSGVVRFKPDGSAFEQFSSKGGNTWGLQISWDNEVFWTQPTSGDLLMHTVMSENQLARAGVRGLTSFRVVSKSLDVFPAMSHDQLPYVQIDWVGKFTAAAGCAIYDGGTWPAKWNYAYFCTEPTINIVHHQLVNADGVSYAAHREAGRETAEFIGGKNIWFRPIETRIGPDGALYVVDFCNQAVIHNDTRGPKHGPHNAAIRPDRDHYYGRIWRVDHKDAKKIEVPNLAKASASDLVKALEHPNQHVRMNATRLLIESKDDSATKALKSLVDSETATPASRIHALWILAQTSRLEENVVNSALQSKQPSLRRNLNLAFVEIFRAPTNSAFGAQRNFAPMSALYPLSEPDPKARLAALLLASELGMGEELLKSDHMTERLCLGLLGGYGHLDDEWSRAALMGVYNQYPLAFLRIALVVDPELMKDKNDLRPVLPLIARQLALKGDAKLVALLVLYCSWSHEDSYDVKRVMLQSLAAELNSSVVPQWDTELKEALKKLLSSSHAELAAAVLPLVARWDKQGELAREAKPQLEHLISKLSDESIAEDKRGQIVENLLGARQMNPEIVPSVAKILSSSASTTMKTRVVTALGALPDDNLGVALVKALPQLPGEPQSVALDQLLKRASWSSALLDALDSGAVPPTLLGPANVHRLRLHPNATVAQRANGIMDKLRGPEAKEKAALIAKFTPEVEKPGNVAKGKELYTANCATCHQLGTLGNLVGPPLTGMGAHGPAELLVHILDPNKEVEFSYVAWSIETKDGEILDGVIARENPSMVALRNAAGEKEILKSTITSRRNTGRSLMPEGLEALGAEALRDILAFICADYARFRIVDLAAAFTADSRGGLYAGPDAGQGSLPLAKYGIVSAFGVPFKIVDAAKSPSTKNLMVLKGGPDNSYAKKTFPKSVEAHVGVAAKQIHVLGNVGGWAFPFGGGEGVPVLKVTAHYVGGATEEIIFKNGAEFADYIREVDVPGSKLAKGIAERGQVRFASRKLTGTGVVEKLTFESYDNVVAPTTVAVTVDLSSDPLPAGAPAVSGGVPASNNPAPKKAGKKGDGKKKNAPTQVASAAPAAPEKIPSVGPMKWGRGTKVLLVGGGSAHDFEKFFHQSDTATLTAARYSVNYTESPEDTVRELKKADVAVLSVNRAAWATPELRQALFDFANKGKGIVLEHAGIWYNFKDWPEFNAQIVGGGSRGHDKLGEFKVNVLKDHPITKGVTKSFAVTDELYYMTPDETATPIEVLAETSPSLKWEKPHPSVFIVKHPKARIAAIALGHDEKTHDLPEFKQLLGNAVKWAAKK